EMVARLFKNKIKDALRLNLTGHFVGSEERCISIIVEFLNRVFGTDKFNTDKDFWTVTIKTWMVEKYGNGACGLSETELDSKFDLSTILSISQVIAKFQLKSGIKLSSRIKKSLLDSSQDPKLPLPVLLYTDIKSYRPFIKHSNMIARSEGISLYMKAIELIYANQVYFGKPIPPPDYNRFNNNFNEEISLLEACNQKLNLASRSSTTDGSLYHLLGLVDFELLKLKPNACESLKKSAIEKLSLSVKYNPSPNNMLSLASLYDVSGKHKQAMEIYESLSLLDPFVIVPLLFESASLYSPFFSKVTDLIILNISFHQFNVLIQILKGLSADHAMVKQYLNDCFQIFGVLILKTLSVIDLSYQRSLLQIYNIRENLGEIHDFEKVFGPVIQECLEYNYDIFDEFIKEASNSFSSRISFTVFVLLSQHSTKLASKIKEYVESNSVDAFDQNVVKAIFYNDKSAQILVEIMNAQVKSLIVKRKPLDLSKMNSIENLYIENLFLTPENLALFETLASVAKQVVKLDIREIRGSDIDINETCLQFSSLKSLYYEATYFSNSLFKSIISSCQDTLLELEFNQLELSEGILNKIKGCKKLEKFKIRYSSGDIGFLPQYLPSSVTNLEIYCQLYDVDNPMQEILAYCPNIVSLKVNDVDQIMKTDQLKLAKKCPLHHLDLNSYQSYMELNEMEKDLDVWSKSLTSLILFINRPYDQFDQFISSLVSLETLDLRYNNLTDSNIDTILSKLVNLKQLKISTTKYLLNSTNVSSKSITKLEIANCYAPAANYKNIGIIYPNLLEVSISNPNSFTDVSFKSMIEHLPCLESIQLAACFQLTDASMIALANSPISKSLQSLFTRDYIVSDSSFVKILESCTKLKILRPSAPFKRSLTSSYIRAKFKNIHLDFS
ncbi:hypothetical protein CYY_010378, partial [Polysphondylium violaceum]